MMGMYRLVRDENPAFYEFMMLADEKDSLVLRLKHFNPNLTGWEEKDKTVDFPFVTKTNGTVYFEGITYRAEGPDAVTCFLALKQKDGSIREEEFHYKRIAIVD